MVCFKCLFCLQVNEACALCMEMFYDHEDICEQYDFFTAKDVDFVVSLLESENENVPVLGAIIITGSRWSVPE